MAEKQAAGSIVDYKDTLNLPHTQFPLRTQGIIDEQPIRDLWDKMQLYDLAMKRNKGARTFILHDGPPLSTKSGLSFAILPLSQGFPGNKSLILFHCSFDNSYRALPRFFMFIHL